VIIDSVLSEEAVLGFEYGFSTAEPNAAGDLEAQFGDFANGAQVVMDQFISSGETKWGRVCGLTQFLPHGYEGQGPSTALRVSSVTCSCAPSTTCRSACRRTAAQIFHLVRRQMLRPFRKPLVVMTPKSLLRKRGLGLDTRARQRLVPDGDPGGRAARGEGREAGHRLLRKGLL